MYSLFHEYSSWIFIFCFSFCYFIREILDQMIKSIMNFDAVFHDDKN